MELEQLYERYGPMVLRRCRQLLRDEDEALDVAQDVFVRALQAGSRAQVAYPSSFLYVTATNLCLNRIRDRRRRGGVSAAPELERIAALDDLEPRISARSTLRRLFGQSPESSRLIAVLHHVDGLTLEETAREVGMSVSGVRKRLRALRTKLERIEAS